MPRLNESTRQERRTRIAMAALRCFARDGIANTSMADVIKESGLSNGAIYSHFESKADLLRFTVSSALEARFTGFLDGADGAGEDITPDSLLSRMLDGSEIGREQTRTLVQVWGEVARDPELSAVAGENVARLRALISDSLRPWADTRAATPSESASLALRTADALITTMFGYAVRIALDPAAEPESLRDSLIAVTAQTPVPTS